jgi:hypothetical protein
MVAFILRLCLIMSAMAGVYGFIQSYTTSIKSFSLRSRNQSSSITSLTQLFASKGFAKKPSPPCPCGSNLPYSTCTCSVLHSCLSPSLNLSPSYSSATPEEVVRSRYSAYSLKSIPYIIKTTSKDNPQHYLEDFEVWKARLEEVRGHC